MASALTSFSLVLSTIGATVNTSLSTASVDPVRFPLSNTEDKTHPLRTGRIAAPSYPTIANNGFAIYYNMPTGVTVAGCFVDNCNFTGTLYFQSVNSSGASPQTLTLADGGTLSKDPRTGRIKGYFRFASPIYMDGTTEAKIKLSTNGGTIDSSYGITDVSIGSAAFFEPDKEISFPGGFMNDIEIEIMDPKEDSTFETGSYEVIEIGEPYVTITLPNRVFYDTQETEFLNLVANRTTPFIIWENEGNLSRAYTVRLNKKSTKLDYQVRARAFQSTLSFIELI